MVFKKDSIKEKKREEISRRLDEAEKKEGLDKANDLKEIIGEFKKLIRISDLTSVKELKPIVRELEKEYDRLIEEDKEKIREEKRVEEID